MSGTSPTVAILLAAGGGSRFAGLPHKLTALIAGRAVCVWSLQHLIEANIGHIVVVTGAVDLTSSLEMLLTSKLLASQVSSVQLVHNPLWQSGLASSLQCGLVVARDRGAQAVVVGLADQPAVPPSAWQRVAQSHAPLAVATYGGIRGNPVRLHAELWPLLPATGDEGARSLLRSQRDLIEEVPCLGSPRDVDTTDDLEELSKLLTGK